MGVSQILSNMVWTWMVWIYLLSFSCLICARDMTKHEKAACTGEQLELSCEEEPHCRLEIQRAVYVHKEQGSCDVSSSGCESNATEVEASCRGKHKCVVNVRQERASNMCLYISSHLLVQYACNCESCETLHEPRNGKITYLPKAPGSTEEEVVYECSPGFEIVGPSRRKCTNRHSWTGVNPACSIPASVCPASVHPVFTYGEVCLEFISSQVMSWEDAAEHCSSNNASLINARNVDELSFVQWKLHQPASNLYLWVDAGKRTGIYGSCPELIFSFTNKQWMFSKASCSYRNNFFCRHEYHNPHVDKSGLSMRSFIPGLFIGFVIGTALFTTVICLLNARRANQKQMLEDEIYQVTATTPHIEHIGRIMNRPMSMSEDGSGPGVRSGAHGQSYHEEDENSNDLYDDTCSVGGSRNINRIGNSACPSNEESIYEYTEGQPTFDDINKVLDDVIQGHIQHSLANGTYEPNVYENIAVARVADSIRKHLISSSSFVGEDDCAAEESQGSGTPSVKKPKPAPKPMRRKTLSQSDICDKQINENISDEAADQGPMISDTEIIDSELNQNVTPQGIEEPMTEL